MIDRLSDERARAAAGGALLPRLGRELPRALRRGGRARRPRHRDRPRHRRGPAARADRCSAKGYPFEMQGRLAEATEVCEAAVEAARLADKPAVPVLGAVRARLGALLPRQPRRRRSRRARRARGSAAAWRAARCRPRAEALAGRSRRALFELGDVERGFETMRQLGRTSCATRSRWSAASTGRSWRWPSSRAGTLGGGRAATWRAPRSTPRRLGLRLPSRARPRAPAPPCCSPPGTPREGRRAARGVRRKADRDRRRPPGGVLAQPARAARSPRRASARRPIAALREAESELDALRLACACATRCAASCASSARAPRRAGARPRRGLRDRRADEA